MTNEIVASPVRRRWPDWIGYLTAGWAAGYATLALVWTVTGRGFPFGVGNSQSSGALRGLPADVGAPLFAAMLAAVAVLALVMVTSRGTAGAARGLLTGAGWTLAAVLLFVVPETTLLAVAGYAPLLLVGAPFGWPDIDYSEVFTWPLANQAFSVLGGFLLAGTVLAWQRRIRSACQRCGRGEQNPEWTAPAAAARWGRWAVAIAVIIPMMYAVTRIAWLLWIPLGVPDGFLEDLHADGGAWAGAWLGTFAVIGGLLTLGLAQRWGERFPRWIPGLAGRRVPISLAVIPAAAVSVMVTSAGIGLITFEELYSNLADGMWSLLPHLLWPVWGAALAAATLAYYLRRRSRCRTCGRG